MCEHNSSLFQQFHTWAQVAQEKKQNWHFFHSSAVGLNLSTARNTRQLQQQRCDLVALLLFF